MSSSSLGSSIISMGGSIFTRLYILVLCFKCFIADIIIFWAWALFIGSLWFRFLDPIGSLDFS